MDSQPNYLRGPVLSYVYKDDLLTNSTSKALYDSDAIIIEESGKIREFGSAINLLEMIPKGVLIETFKVCRIIKTTIQSH